MASHPPQVMVLSEFLNIGFACVLLRWMALFLTGRADSALSQPSMRMLTTLWSLFQTPPLELYGWIY
jgi:hypothetical protein